jgi:hypothetical protein
MRHHLFLLGLILIAGRLSAAERIFDFSKMPTNQPPADAVSTVAGGGKPGVWKVLMDEAPMPSIDSNSPIVVKKSVVGQLASDATDEHFPLLILGGDTYGDFTFTTRVKIVDGVTEQMGGIAFRIQDEKNFYVLRVSALGRNVLFYKVVNGMRGDLFGPRMDIPRGQWLELSVECRGNRILCLLNGREIMPAAIDNSFTSGKLGFWTKSDSISYFTDAHVTYVPREPFAKQLVDDTMKEYPRLLGLKVYTKTGNADETRLIASTDQTGIGQPGAKSDIDVINRGVNYFLKDKESVVVTMPLRDRNGDPQAAVQITMKTFPGQTEENAIVRAMPIIKTMQQRAATATSLTE